MMIVQAGWCWIKRSCGNKLVVNEYVKKNMGFINYMEDKIDFSDVKNRRDLDRKLHTFLKKGKPYTTEPSKKQLDLFATYLDVGEEPTYITRTTESIKVSGIERDVYHGVIFGKEKSYDIEYYDNGFTRNTGKKYLIRDANTKKIIGWTNEPEKYQ